MGVEGIGGSVDIAISGLRAQSRRMNVIADNIANANTTRGPDGKPYCRQDVVLHTDADAIGGVQVEGVTNDLSGEFARIQMAGHPDADADGFVTMPNVSLPNEMMNLVVASRAYQANAAILKRYQESVDVTLELLR